MASSDNVVRAGLTPKHKDIPTLISMLTYSHGPASEQILRGEPIGCSGASRLYNPPIEEFSIIRTTLTDDLPEDEFKSIDGPSILVVTEGSAILQTSDSQKIDTEKGHVFFVGANTPLRLHLAEKSETATLYRAYCVANL